MKNRFLRQLILGLSVCSIMLVNTKVVDASPWASPDDLLFRHDLQILVDSGALNIPISTWPLAWGDIAYNLTKNESEMSLIEITSFQRIKEALIEAEMGGLGGQTEIKVAKNPNQMTWFNDSVTNTKSVGAQSSYLSKNLALNIKVEKIPGKTLLDESYLAIARGNYSLTLGSKKNWWGPGWDSSLVLSSNARPIRGLSIERNFSDPFESAFLKWIGPWDLSVVIGELDNNRSISDPKFFGMRFGFRPTSSLELGLSRTSLFCGENLSCGFSTFTDMLIDKNDDGYNAVGIDFRSSHKMKNIPFAVYGQLMGEPFNNTMGLFGMETWGLINSNQQLESYRFFVEASSTSCQFYKNDSEKYGCAYRNDLYTDGYRYAGSSIGHTSDGDSMVLSLGGILVGENSQLFKSKLSLGQLNRGSINSYQLREHQTNFFNIDLGYEFDLYWFDIPLGSFDLGVGYDMYKDKVDNTSENEPRIYVAWNNDMNFTEEKTMDFSEYIELIEVSDEEIITEELVKNDLNAFRDLGNFELFEIIELFDDVTTQRSDKNIMTKVTTNIQSVENILSELNSISDDGKTLSDYLGLMDSTISQRN
ncbi:MAG: capsule assembly Wzi family protein [Gammaproteobacteria bacterium]|nr:capsule assembly Wzi family protein [Gammaproteobacteria bacterium]